MVRADRVSLGWKMRLRERIWGGQQRPDPCRVLYDVKNSNCSCFVRQFRIPDPEYGNFMTMR